MNKEVWKDVIGYKGLYRVSNLGRIYSYPRSGTFGKVIRQFSGGRYLTVSLSKKNRHKTRLVHHLILEAFIGFRPFGTECRHLDGNQQNNKLDNLRWGTHSTNMQDKVRHGTDNRGEKHKMSKLTNLDICEIRYLYSVCKLSQLVLADRFGVRRRTINYIINKQTWRHIK